MKLASAICMCSHSSNKEYKVNMWDGSLDFLYSVCEGARTEQLIEM